MPLAGLFHHFAVLHAFVGDDSAPGQGFDDILFGSRYKAMGVRIFYANDKVTTFLLGIQIVIQSGADAAHVERSGGGGGESYAGSSFHVFLILEVQR